MNKTRAKYSYGIAIDRLWKSQSDSQGRNKNGNVENAFGMLVSRNEEYEDGYKMDFDYWIPSNTNKLNIILYASEDQFARYVFEEDGVTLPKEEGKKCFEVKSFFLLLDTVYEERKEFKITLEYRQSGINLSFIDPNNGERTFVKVDTTAQPGTQ